MKKNFLFRPAALPVLSLALLFTACSDETTGENPTPNPNGGTASDKYVIAATVDNVTSLLTVESIDEGFVSALNNGLEVDAGTYYIFKDKDALFRLVYNQGSAGTGSSYFLNASGALQEDLSFEMQRFTSYGFWGNNVITSSTGNTTITDAEGNYAQGFLVNYLDATTGSMSSQTYLGENFLGNGEKVCFSGFVEKNGKLYTSVIPMGMSKYGVLAHPDKVVSQDYVAKADGGSNSGSYKQGEIPSTQFPDSAFVAIYSGSNFSEHPVIVRTDSIGYACGRSRSQYYQTIWAADNGDIYVFSPGYGRTTKGDATLARVTGQRPSGVMRIKAGATEFDPTYYYNLETLGNNHALYRCWPIAEDYFLLQFYTDGLNAKGENTLELGVFQGSTGRLTMVTGLPETDVLTSFGQNPFAENGAIYIPVVTKDGRNPALYKIDAATAAATRGIEIQAASVSAIGRLSPRN